MKNGTYKVTHKMLGGNYTAVCYNGKVTLKDDEGVYLQTLTAPKFEEHYHIYTQMEDNNIYTLVYFSGGLQKPVSPQIIGSYSLCKFKQSELSKLSQYRNGKIIIQKF